MFLTTQKSREERMMTMMKVKMLEAKVPISRQKKMAAALKPKVAMQAMGCPAFLRSKLSLLAATTSSAGLPAGSAALGGGALGALFSIVTPKLRSSANSAMLSDFLNNTNRSSHKWVLPTSPTPLLPSSCSLFPPRPLNNRTAMSRMNKCLQWLCCCCDHSTENPQLRPRPSPPKKYRKPSQAGTTRLLTKYKREEFVAMSEEERLNSEKKPYCCPICTLYFKRILACSQCCNFICLGCLEQYECKSRTSQQSMKCSFCASITSKFVDYELDPHSYFDASKNGFISKQDRDRIDKEMVAVEQQPGPAEVYHHEISVEEMGVRVEGGGEA